MSLRDHHGETPLAEASEMHFLVIAILFWYVPWGDPLAKASGKHLLVITMLFCSLSWLDRLARASG